MCVCGEGEEGVCCEEAWAAERGCEGKSLEG